MKETPRFYTSLSLLILLNVIVKPVWIFGIDRQVQVIAGAGAYGSYFSILNLSIALSFLLDWGLTVYYNRQLSLQGEVHGGAGGFAALKLLFSAFYALVIFAVAFFSGIRQWEVLVDVVLIQVLTSFLLFYRAMITSRQWFRADAYLSVLDKFLMIIFCGSLIYFPSVFGHIDIRRFLFFQYVSLAIACLAAVLISRSRVNFRLKGLLPSRAFFKSALPFTVIVFLMSFHSRIDGFLLERIKGAEEAGKYAAAFRLLDASNMLGYLFASFMLPFVARQWSAGKDFSAVVLQSRHLLVGASISLTLIVFFMAPWLQLALYHHADENSATVLRWCMPALIGYYLVQVYGSVMTATGHIIPFIYITSASVIINILINVLLIPRLGALGCCIAAISSQAFSGAGVAWYVHRNLNMRFQWRSVLAYLLMGALVAAFLLLMNGTDVNKWLIILGAGLLSVLVLTATKLMSLDFRKLIVQ